MIKKFLRKAGILPEKPKSPAVSSEQEQTPSSVKEQTASKTVRALGQKGINNGPSEKAPKNKAQLLARKIYSGKITISSPVYDKQIVSIRFPIPSIDEGVLMGFKDENHYKKGISIIMSHILEKELHLDWRLELEDIERGGFNGFVTSKKGPPDKKIIFHFDKDGGYMEEVVDMVQFLAKKIYDERKEKYSLAHSKQVVSTRFFIPSLNEGGLMGFQSSMDYIGRALIIIADIFQKEFHMKLVFSKKDVLNGHFEREIPSEGGLPDRKIVFDFKDSGGYIDIIGRDSITGTTGISTPHVVNTQYCQKGMNLLDIKKPSDGKDGVDVRGEKIHQEYVKYGEGIELKSIDLVNRVGYFAEIDGFVEIVEGGNRHGLQVVQYIAMNNNFEVGDIDEGTFQKCAESLNVNVKVRDDIGRKVAIKVVGNIECRIMNYPTEVVSTGGGIFVLKEIRGTNIRGRFISLKNDYAVTSMVGDTVISANAVVLSNTTFRGNLTINIGKGVLDKKQNGLFEAKKKLLENIQERKQLIDERDARLEKMIEDIKKNLEALLPSQNKNKKNEEGERRQKLSQEDEKILQGVVDEIKNYTSEQTEEVQNVIVALYRNPRFSIYTDIWDEMFHFNTLISIYEKNNESKELQGEKEKELGRINTALQFLFISIDGEIRDAGKIIINYGIGTKDPLVLEHDGPVKVYKRYNPETDELEDVPKEYIEQQLKRIKRRLPGVSR